MNQINFLQNLQLYLKRFAIENDKQLARSTLTAFAVGLFGFFYLHSLPQIDKRYLPTIVKEPNHNHTSIVISFSPQIKIVEQQHYNKNHAPSPQKKSKGNGEHQGFAGKLRINPIASLTQNLGLRSALQLEKSVVNDFNKVLNSVTGITQTSRSRIGVRPGKQGSDWNEGYATGSETGVDILIDENKLNSPFRTNRSIKALVPVSPLDIEMNAETSQRSLLSIQRTIREHLSGLRHLYNKFLKTENGLGGKVTLRLNISPSGAILSAAILASSSNIQDFDKQILAAVQTWRFDPIKGTGNEEVTIPFNFSE